VNDNGKEVWAVGGLNAPPYQLSTNFIKCTNDE